MVVEQGDSFCIDDFMKYVEEQFDCKISVKKSDKPDTFVGIFGASFLREPESVEYYNAESDKKLSEHDETYELFDSPFM